MDNNLIAVHFQKCHVCSIDFITAIPNQTCVDCIRKHIYKNTNKWTKYKIFSYQILMLFPLFIFIGLEFGDVTQMLMVFIFLYGQRSNDILRWLMRKF